MKNFAFLFVVISALVFFASCSKDQNPQPNSNVNRVKSYTEDVNSSSGEIKTTFNLSYDNNGRIISVISATSAGDKFLFTYPSANKFSMDLYVSGALSIHEDFFLNSNSLIDSTYQYDDSQDITTEKYFYNSGNQLTKLNEYFSDPDPILSNVTSYTYDSNGNLVETTDSNNQVETYEYYPDLVNTMPGIIPGQISAKKMNLMKTHTVTSNGYEVGSATAVYTFDSNNRISTITETDNNGNVVTKTFTYF